MTSTSKPVSVTHERLADVQVDGTMLVFLRHYVHSGKDGKVLRVHDTDLQGLPYETTGLQQRPGPFDVYAGVMCVNDPEAPGVPLRVKQFLSSTGVITYTTVEGFYLAELPVGATITECEG